MSEAMTGYYCSWLSRSEVGSMGGWISDATNYTCGSTSVATTVHSNWDRRLRLSAHTNHLTPAKVGSYLSREWLGLPGNDWWFIYCVGSWLTVIELDSYIGKMDESIIGSIMSHEVRKDLGLLLGRLLSQCLSQ